MFWEHAADLCDMLHSNISSHLVSTQLRCIGHALLPILHIMHLPQGLTALLYFFIVAESYSAIPRGNPKVRKLMPSKNEGYKSMGKYLYVYLLMRQERTSSKTHHCFWFLFLFSSPYPVSLYHLFTGTTSKINHLHANVYLHISGSALEQSKLRQRVK